MRSIAYVISDLHLGGSPAKAGKPALQMTSPESVQRLAAFLERLPSMANGADLHLIIAGDIVDFLAEEPFEAFTATPSKAVEKLERIFETTALFWSALRSFVTRREGMLTLMLGNHDIELSLPGVRERLEQEIGSGRVRFIYDNEALTIGPVLIEHGNRFDPWNAVPHGALRRVRSQLSRRLPVSPNFPALPGSRLVVEVMNELKRTHPFIDLLKPEGSGAVPVAAALGAGKIDDVWRFFRQFVRQQSLDYDEEGEPSDEGLMGAEIAADQGFPVGDDDGEMAASDVARRWVEVAGQKIEAARHEAAFQAIRACRQVHRQAFDIDHEEANYLAPARRAAAAGFQVIVYGHTHLAKRVLLKDGLTDALYLNTGTWADVMAVPEGLWLADVGSARVAFTGFVDALRQGDPSRWRRSAPTYVRLEFDGDRLSPGGAAVFFADDDSPLTTAGLLRRVVVTAGGDHA